MIAKQKVRVTKKFTFDMAHALYGYDGPCKNIHGHTYHFRLTLIGEAIQNSSNPKNGMVIDFTELKHIVSKNVIEVFDHALVLNANSPHKKMNELQDTFEKVIYVDYQPSCENLILDFLNRIKNHLPLSVSIHNLRLDETPTSYAEWFESDNN